MIKDLLIVKAVYLIHLKINYKKNIEKITWGLAITLMVLCVSSSFVSNNSSATGELKDTELREKIESAPTTKPLQGLSNGAENEAGTPPSAGESKGTED